MLNLCVTADHELFNGKNSMTGEHVTVKPTNRLINLLEDHGVKLTLFTDVCSLERFGQLLPDDPFPRLMEEQLRYAVKRGHDVQLHVHPHWYDSFFENGQWRFDYRRYRLQEWGFDLEVPTNAQVIIRNSKKYLETQLKPVDPDYQCIGFRAGGLCVQPEHQLLKALLNEGIWIDSTVFNGGYNSNPFYGFDFRKAPDLDSWWISPEKGLLIPLEAGPDRVFEVAIGSSGKKIMNIFNKCIYRIDRRLKKRNPQIKRGCSNEELPDLKKSLRRRIRDWISLPVLLSFDNACSRSMLDIVEGYVCNDSRMSNDTYVSIVGHPKNLQKDDYLELGRFFNETRRRYCGKVRFVTLRDIADMQKHNRGV